MIRDGDFQKVLATGTWPDKGKASSSRLTSHKSAEYVSTWVKEQLEAIHANGEQIGVGRLEGVYRRDNPGRSVHRDTFRAAFASTASALGWGRRGGRPKKSSG